MTLAAPQPLGLDVAGVSRAQLAVLGWSLGCCALLALATWIGGTAVRRSRSVALAVTGGLLVGMVGLDLLPDAVRRGAVQGIPALPLIGLAGVAGGAVWLLGRPGTRRSAAPSGWPGRCDAAAGALAAHRVVEGATLGLTATSDLRAAAVLALALGLHGSCEGAVLAVSLTSAQRSTRSVLTWLVLLSAAPLVGVVWGLRSAAPELGAWTLAAVSGVLLAAGAVNLRHAAGHLTAGRSVSLAAAGLGLLALSTRLVG